MTYNTDVLNQMVYNKTFPLLCKQISPKYIGYKLGWRGTYIGITESSSSNFQLPTSQDLQASLSLFFFFFGSFFFFALAGTYKC